MLGAVLGHVCVLVVMLGVAMCFCLRRSDRRLGLWRCKALLDRQMVLWWVHLVAVLVLLLPWVHWAHSHRLSRFRPHCWVVWSWMVVGLLCLMCCACAWRDRVEVGVLLMTYWVQSRVQELDVRCSIQWWWSQEVWRRQDNPRPLKSDVIVAVEAQVNIPAFHAGVRGARYLASVELGPAESRREATRLPGYLPRLPTSLLAEWHRRRGSPFITLASGWLLVIPYPITS